MDEFISNDGGDDCDEEMLRARARTNELLAPRRRSVEMKGQRKPLFLVGRFLSYSLLLLTLRLSATNDEQEGSVDRASAALVQTTLMDTNAVSYLETLSDEFGNRVTGTTAYQRAAEWAAERFRAAGIPNVRLEPFTIPNGWERGPAAGRLVSPIERPIHLGSFGWSPATPPNGLKGQVVSLDEYSLQKIENERKRIEGHIVIVTLSAFFAERRNAYTDFSTSFERLRDVGALAVLVIAGDPDSLLMALPLSNGARVVALPVAEVAMEDGLLLKRWLEKGPVTVEINLQNKVVGRVSANNIVAEIAGREKPDEWIVVGAHFDDWDYGTGAQDNGSGVATVYEAARAIQALGRPPRRSIMFVLWGGEEEGILGSRAYVQAHGAELSKCVAALVTDAGAGHPRGWDVSGREDLLEAMKPISQTLAGLGGDGLRKELEFGSDHGAFVIEGIPALEFWADETNYERIHHKPGDTFDKVDAHNLQDAAAIVAVTAYAVADMPKPVAPHIDHAAVEQILKKANLDEYLRENGIWK